MPYWILTPISVTLFASAMVALLIAGMVWPRRRAPGGWYLFFLMLSCALWSIGDGIEASATSEWLKVLVIKFGYIGTQNIPPLFFMLALVHSQKEYLLTKWKQRVLWAFPVIIILLAFTNEWHHLIWSSFTWDSDPSLNLLHFNKGFYYWINTAYAYIVLVWATVLLVRNALQTPKIYRRQAWGLVGAALLPWGSNIMWVLGVGPFPGQNLTAIFFTFTGFFMFVNMQHLKLLDLAPIARHQLVELMQDAVIVLDMQNRVVDINPTAEVLFGTFSDIAVGRSVESTLLDWSELVEEFQDVDQINTEITFGQDGDMQYFDLQISPLTTRKNGHLGRLVSLRDITDYKNLFLEMEKLAITDMLTGLYNYHHFMLLATREFDVALRYQKPLAIVMIDLDGFKTVNDTYGHLVGDQLLQGLGQIFLEILRSIDIPARFGGDEFIFLLSETDMEGAYKVAERLRQKVAKLTLETPRGMVNITISQGIAVICEESKDLDKLIYQADQALYQAKNTGRNQTVVYREKIEL